jgi:hypothetical protein
MSQKTSLKENGNASIEASAKESILEKVRRNVEKLKEAKKNTSSGFLKFQPGETKVLNFTGDFEPVQRSFKRKNAVGAEEETTKTMYGYKVMDMGNQDAGIITWEVSRQWSDSIDNLLVKGFLTLEVERKGSGTDTSYLFSPAVAATAK